jgi:lipopolysaccharide assembly outer membrane protein LptD (OstA)
MSYQITTFTKNRAEKLNVDIKPSTDKKKKIDVYKNNIKIASVGAISYSDYPTYLKSHGIKYAKERRRQYHMRHRKDENVVGSNGYYAALLLW